MSVSCVDVRDAFLRGEPPSGAELAQHLRECAECRELCAADAELGRALSQLSALADDDARVRELAPPELARETGLRAFLRSRPTRVRVALLVLLAALLAALSYALNGRDLSETPIARLYGVVALYLAGVWLAARRGLLGAAELGYQRHVRALALAALAVPVLLAVLTGRTTDADAGPAAAAACFVYGSLWALPACFSFFLLERGERPPAGSFWLVAAVSGFSANLVLELHCPSRHLGHLLFGHAAIGVVALGVALLYRLVPGRRI